MGMHASLGSKNIRYLREEESFNHWSHSECNLLHCTTLCLELKLADNIDVLPRYVTHNQQIHRFCLNDRAYAKAKMDTGDYNILGNGCVHISFRDDLFLVYQCKLLLLFVDRIFVVNLVSCSQFLHPWITSVSNCYQAFRWCLGKFQADCKIQWRKVLSMVKVGFYWSCSKGRWI